MTSEDQILDFIKSSDLAKKAFPNPHMKVSKLVLKEVKGFINLTND